jgi:hypothetical protein
MSYESQQWSSEKKRVNEPEIKERNSGQDGNEDRMTGLQD